MDKVKKRIRKEIRKVGDSIEVSDDGLAKIQSRIAKGKGKKVPRSKLVKADSTPPVQPVTTTTINPHAMRIAREMANGDTRLLKPNPDGSVTILNHPE
jgi:hypothetical protein